MFSSFNFKFNSHWFLLIFAVCALFSIPYYFAVSAEVVDFFEPWNDNVHLDNAVSILNFE